MNEGARYAKVVRWSDEDGCFIGTSPGLLLGGIHGSDERKVFDELCIAVEEAVDLHRREGRPLPPVALAGAPGAA